MEYKFIGGRIPVRLAEEAQQTAKLRGQSFNAWLEELLQANVDQKAVELVAQFFLAQSVRNDVQTVNDVTATVETQPAA